MDLRIEKIQPITYENGRAYCVLDLVSNEEEKRDYIRVADATTEDNCLVYCDVNSQGIYNIGLYEDAGEGRWWSSNPETIEHYLGIKVVRVYINNALSYLSLDDFLKVMPEGYELLRDGYIAKKES